MTDSTLHVLIRRVHSPDRKIEKKTSNSLDRIFLWSNRLSMQAESSPPVKYLLIYVNEYMPQASHIPRMYTDLQT